MHGILAEVLNETRYDRIKWSEQSTLRYFGVHERYTVEWNDSIYPGEQADLTVSIPGKKSKTFSFYRSDDTAEMFRAIEASRKIQTDLVLLALMRGE